MGTRQKPNPWAGLSLGCTSSSFTLGMPGVGDDALGGALTSVPADKQPHSVGGVL